MQRHGTRLLFFCFVLLLSRPARAQSPNTNPTNSSTGATAHDSLALHETRKSPDDLEVGGELAGLPPGSTRFLTRNELLSLPQVTFPSAGDTNFTDSAEIRGVRLEELTGKIAAAPATDMVVAICDDKYRANYPRAYLAAHHPVLVLTVNGQPPSGWPKDSEEHKFDMGPYMISHAKFIPVSMVSSHADEPQIPWGVLRLEFRNEKTVYGGIAPGGPRAIDSDVRAGYQIARQNCFRCHNAGPEGGQKSGVPWPALAAIAATSPQDFGAYVRNPAAKNAQAQMPGNPTYDGATIGALTAYFQTFYQATKP